MIRQRDWAEQPVVIVVAASGAEVTRADNPNVPYTPAEIARSVIDAAGAGASVAHLHVREDDGSPSSRVEVFRECIDRIRAESDIITMVSTGGAMGMSIAERTTGLEAKPDLSSLEVGSLNFFADLFPTLPHEAETIARRATDAGIGLEVEAFEIGHIDTAVEMHRREIIPSPLRINIVLGVPGALAATPHNLIAAAESVPATATWAVTPIGRHQTRLVTMALLLGATCIRVGFEDNVYLRRGVLAQSNAELVDYIAQICDRLGRRVATTSEARAILSI